MDEPVEVNTKEQPAVVCRLLRTKTAFGTFRGNAYTWQSGRSTTAVYWCLRTMETSVQRLAAPAQFNTTHTSATGQSNDSFSPCFR